MKKNKVTIIAIDGKVAPEIMGYVEKQYGGHDMTDINIVPTTKKDIRSTILKNGSAEEAIFTVVVKKVSENDTNTIGELSRKMLRKLEGISKTFTEIKKNTSQGLFIHVHAPKPDNT